MNHTSSLSRGLQLALKHASDRILAAILLICLAPLLAVIAVLIKLDSRGPVFFRQLRTGKDERGFRIWKFRSMIENADDFLDEYGRVGNVNRVTRVGKWLRLTSLDELPQFINIFSGEMSFIGPRPTLPEHLPRFTAEQRRRFHVKPGITGLAQVNGRNRLNWSRRLQLDVEYVDTYSLWLDLKIAFRTVRVVLLREGVTMDRLPEEVDDLHLNVPLRDGIAAATHTTGRTDE